MKLLLFRGGTYHPENRYAHNVKIISENGMVTLKGPVSSGRAKRHRSRRKQPKSPVTIKTRVNWKLSPRNNRTKQEIKEWQVNTAVFGIYTDRSSVERAVDALFDNVHQWARRRGWHERCRSAHIKHIAMAFTIEDSGRNPFAVERWNALFGDGLQPNRT